MEIFIQKWNKKNRNASGATLSPFCHAATKIAADNDNVNYQSREQIEWLIQALAWFLLFFNMF
jgi:hypothetical protein